MHEHLASVSLVLVISASMMVGCGSGKNVLRLDSPQDVVAAFHGSIKGRQYDQVLDLVAPSERTRYAQYFTLCSEYYGETDRLAKIIRERFGPSTWMERTILSHLAISPLRDYDKGGRLDWTHIRFSKPVLDDSRLFVQDLSGHDLVELVRHEGGRWYIKDYDGGACSLAGIPTLRKQVAYFRQLLRELTVKARTAEKQNMERDIATAFDVSLPSSQGGVPSTQKDRDPLLSD